MFEEGGFVPCAKIQNGESYSIITDYLGTPTEMYNSDGKRPGLRSWIFMGVYIPLGAFFERLSVPCYQGQYEDKETEFYDGN